MKPCKSQQVSVNAQLELSESLFRIVNIPFDLCEEVLRFLSDSYPYPHANPLTFENTQNMLPFFIQYADFSIVLIGTIDFNIFQWYNGYYSTNKY